MKQSVKQPLIIGEHRLKFREVETKEGLIFVPSYVYRIDKGWQVRIKRVHEKTYSKSYMDSHHSSCKDSLAIAIENLYDVLPNYCTFDKLRPGSSHWYTVRERFYKDGRECCQLVQTYICGYQGKLRTIQFYVGTPNTRSDLRLRKAIDQAIGTRCWSIDTIKNEGRSVLYVLPVPKDVEKYAC